MTADLFLRTLLDTRNTCVYRMYDADRVLLYVGMTNDTAHRFRQHAKDKPWWCEVDDVEIEWFHGRAVAEDAEAVAIWEEVPCYNVDRPIERANRPRGRIPEPEPIPIHDALERLLAKW